MNSKEAFAKFCAAVERPESEVDHHMFVEVYSHFTLDFGASPEAALAHIIQWIDDPIPESISPANVVASYQRARAWVELVRRGL